MARYTRNSRGVRRSGLAAALAVASAIVLAACSSSASSPSGSSGDATTGGKLESTTITIGLPLPTSTLAPIYLADDNGYWKKRGLTVKLVSFSGGTALTSALLGGSVDLAVGGATGVVQADLQSNSSQLQEVFGGFNVPDYFYFAQKDIKDVKSAEGKVWHITALNTDQGAIAVQLLQQNGLKKSDVHFAQGGGTVVGLAGLKKGTYQVAVAAVPDNFGAAASGYSQIADTQDVYPNGAPLHAVYGKSSWINAHPNTVTAALQGIAQGMMKLKADPDSAAKADESHAKTDPKYTLQGINYMAPFMYPNGQLPDAATMSKWMQVNVAVGLFSKPLDQSVWLNSKWIDSYDSWKPAAP